MDLGKGCKGAQNARTFALPCLYLPVAGRSRLGHRVVAVAGENPVRVFGILGAAREADVDLAEGVITARVGTLVAERIALFQPRDDGGHGLLRRSHGRHIDDLATRFGHDPADPARARNPTRLVQRTSQGVTSDPDTVNDRLGLGQGRVSGTLLCRYPSLSPASAIIHQKLWQKLEEYRGSGERFKIQEKIWCE